MPKNTKFRNTKKSKAYKKRKRFYSKKFKGARSLICRTIGGYPDRYLTPLRASYQRVYSFSEAAGGGLATLDFAINSLIDPIFVNGSSAGQIVGNIARWLGQSNMTGNTLRGSYISYIVHACKIKCTLTVSQSSTAALIPYAGLLEVPRGQTRFSTDVPQGIPEQPGVKSLHFNNYATGPNTVPSTVLKGYYNLKRIKGVKGSTDIHTLEDELRGTYNSAPADTRYVSLCMFTDTAGGADATLKIAVAADVVFYVEFFDRLQTIDVATV